jgi:predicted cupin superfamily sugar epimerase
MKMQDANYWIEKLSLKPHPEGGFYKEVFRSKMEVYLKSSQDPKQACTSIYYLLEGIDYSGFHRIASDELWYYHKGEPLFIYEFDLQGLFRTHELSDQHSGRLSLVIEAGSWFAASIPSGVGFSLVSCAVAPGFEFSEFEMADKASLQALYPSHISILDRFCR